MRTVLDTNIIVSGLLIGGNPRRILDAARDGIIELFASPALIRELENVLSREKFAARLATAEVTAQELCLGIIALSKVIEPQDIEPVVLSDPDDDAVLACAVTAGCEIIVSGDKDLLELKEYKGIRIFSASEFLTELIL